MFQQLVNLIWFCDASFSVPSSKRLRMCFSSCVLVQSSQKKLRGIEISFKSKSSHNLRHQIMEWWSDGMDSMDQWMMLCLLCDAVVFKMFFFAIEKSVETCSLYRFSQSIFNGFSMFDSNTSSSRGFTARFMPQDATGCPRMPQVTWWLDGQLDRPPPISRTARPCHPNNPNPCSRPPDENRTRTGWLWSCEFLISSVTFSVFSPLLLL